ncbi:MAG: hypothetical protein HC918_01815 [Oscillatoriales cyanobacterium SM2_1_8]|nr:hypothetical protein [Oscillatoriales cyanobacterium SM2_1_8]
MAKIAVLGGLVLGLAGCAIATPPPPCPEPFQGDRPSFPQPVQIRHAQGFRVVYGPHHKLVTVGGCPVFVATLWGAPGLFRTIAMWCG